jgi:MFS family permease
MRLYYLLVYCGSGSINPFINLFYINRNLSGTEIGFLGTISALSGLISAPFWGHLNDTIRRPRRILQLALCLTSLAYYFLSQQTVFFGMAVIIGLNSLIASGIDPLTSSQAIGIASESGSGFGSMRLWGSMGWAIAAPFSGWIIQKTSLVSAFYEYIIFLVLGAIVLSMIKGTIKKPVELLSTVEPTAKLPVRLVLKEIISNHELMILLMASVILWVGTNGTKFESVYLQQLGAKDSVIGWVNTVGAVFEMPSMLFADRVMRRKNPTFTLRIGYLIYIVGFTIIVLFPSVTTFMIYRAIGGIGLGFYLTSFTNFIARRAPSQQTATVLALYSVTFAGIINLLASPLSGWIFDLVGPHWLYVMALAGYCIAFLIVYFLVGRKKPEKMVQPSA